MKHFRFGLSLLTFFFVATIIASGGLPASTQDQPEKRADASTSQDKNKETDKQDKDKDENPPAVISDKEPSSDIKSPTPLILGEIVKGRLDASADTGKYHHWLISLSPGKYKIVLDVKRADDRIENGAFLGGYLEWFSTEGEKIEQLDRVFINGEYRWRLICRFEVKKPLKRILRYANEHTILDYWLGLFKTVEKVRTPYFAKCPKVQRLALGKAAQAIVDGVSPFARDVWYSIELAPGDYKVITEWARVDGQVAFVGGNLSTYSAEGDWKQTFLSSVESNEVSTKKIGKLSLADKTTVLFRVSGDYTKESVSLSIDKIQDE
jgi:hypothetical protein